MGTASKPSSSSTQLPEIIIATVAGSPVTAAWSSMPYQSSIRSFWRWWIPPRYSVVLTAVIRAPFALLVKYQRLYKRFHFRAQSVEGKQFFLELQQQVRQSHLVEFLFEEHVIEIGRFAEFGDQQDCGVGPGAADLF